MIRALAFAVLALLAATALPAAEQLFADLGACRLESGETIDDCRVGYRTLGRLNADQSNVILWPTWFGGKSADLERFVAADAFLDPAKYYVVLVDALGNGVSSSPSNTDGDFPDITIGDMVETQRRLLVERLSVDRVHAVMGISMGGMQTYEWIVRHPEMMDRAIPIVGSPRLGAYDVIAWRSELEAIETAYAAYPRNIDKARRVAYRLIAGPNRLLLTTPAEINREIDPDEAAQAVAERAESSRENQDPLDRAVQLRAMISTDVTDVVGGSLAAAADAVEAETLTIVAAEDHMVTPQPALAFAAALDGRTVILTGDCGHLAPGDCDFAQTAAAVQDFLSR